MEVFSFKIWDHVDRCDIKNSRLSTRQFIETVPGASALGPGRLVDQRLVNVNGQLVINPKCASAKLLKRLDEIEVHTLESDEFVRLSEELSNARLAVSARLDDNNFVYNVTELGRIFILEVF